MKILVIADVHSNWPALASIRESFDACLLIGDLVDYGSDPVSCIDWAREHVTAAIRGNHDHAVAQGVACRTGAGFRRLAAVARPIHWQVLTPDRRTWLARLPVTTYVTFGDLTFFLVHATPRDPMDEYLVDDEEAWQTRLESINADFVCVGHTHLPMHLKLDRLQLINPGSVGQPRDGDPRCSYVVIEDGRVEFRRTEYDIDACVRHMRESGFDAEALEMAESVLRTGGKFPGNGPPGG